MSLLFETIACRNGKLQNLEWHNARMNDSRRKLFNASYQLSLEEIHLPTFVKKGYWKCKILYSDTITGVAFEPYLPRKINSLALINSNIGYNYKYADRDELDKLFGRKKGADDILIVKNGYVTDTSIANILLYDGHQWVTPDTPLLMGTMRSQLIYTGKIKVASVKKTDLPKYSKIMLVNAMNPFNENKSFPLLKSLQNF